MKMFVLALLAFCLNAYADRAFDISFPQGISREETTLFKKTIETALGKLPQEVQDYKFNIKVQKLDKDFNPNICDPNAGNTFGRAETILGNKTLYIHQGLVKLATFNNQETFKCFHKSYLRTLEATIVHELIHYYDNKYEISDERVFRDLVGGAQASLFSKHKLMNKSAQGSPDYYEYKNYKEALAVNFEYFTFDENYQCSKPAYHRFLKKKFNLVPFPEKDCSQQSYVLISDTDFNKNLRQKVSLDAKRIYQIHYLHAGNGSAMMSRWGHAMFRIVTCAPSRKEVGPECLNDISHHLVVSYRANVSGISINYLSGLAGSYPSEIFIYRLYDVIQEYTRSELRDLWSVPLNLNSNEREQFINITLQHFWDYKGSYYFFSNNCATELQKHLIAAKEDNSIELHALTPRKIFKIMTKPGNKFLDSTLFDLSQKEEMRKLGLLFVSEEGEILKTLKTVEELGHPLFKSLKSVKKSSGIERKKIYEDIIKNKKKNNVEFYASLLKLEKYLFYIFNQKLSDDLLKVGRKDNATRTKIEEFVKANDMLFLDQWKIIKDSTGYGVPTVSDINHGLASISKSSSTFNDFILTVYKDLPEFKKIQEDIITLNQVGLLLRSKLKELML